MCYTDSPAFALNPTHCSACGRPLVDATSVEFSIGPVCRKKYKYEDAYPIDEKTSAKVVAILQNLSNVDVADKAMNAVLADDSRRANNVLNRAVAVLAKEDREHKDITFALEAMKTMGYTELADQIAGRLADVEVTVENGRIIFDTPFEPDFIEAIKGIKGRRWDKERKVWTVPVSQKAEAWEALQSAYEGLLGHGPKGMFRI